MSKFTLTFSVLENTTLSSALSISRDMFLSRLSHLLLDTYDMKRYFIARTVTPTFNIMSAAQPRVRKCVRLCL